MRLWWGALRAESRKTLASPVPWATGLVGLLFPLVGALFMLIVRDPEGARALGILGTKARLSGLTADWPSYLSFINQAMAAGFLFLSALFTSWIFGREWSDRTLKLLLATPAGRGRVVGAKFVVITVWGIGTLLLMGAAAWGLGTWLDLPDSRALTAGWVVRFTVGGLLTLALAPWVAFFAGVGRGYLLPVAWTMTTLVAAQLAAVLGWGAWMPWAIPALIALAPPDLPVGPEGVFLVLGSGLAGGAATALFWQRADHQR